AGFMEPGETLEEAVRREVFEESGIRIGRVRYLASQPWPFPSSLMMGFLGEALTDEITIDPEELAEVRWFDRGEVRAMVERSRPGPDRGGAAVGGRAFRLRSGRGRSRRFFAAGRRAAAGGRDSGRARPARRAHQQLRSVFAAISAFGGPFRADFCGQSPRAVP